jgi:hypothetical protein
MPHDAAHRTLPLRSAGELNLWPEPNISSHVVHRRLASGDGLTEAWKGPAMKAILESLDVGERTGSLETGNARNCRMRSDAEENPIAA